MATHVERFKIDPIWGDAYQHLDYTVEPFNNPSDVKRWMDLGFSPKFTGAMCDMRKPQPVWTNAIIAKFTAKGWKNVCTSFYRMEPGTILPEHSDTYKRYIEIHKLEFYRTHIQRAIVFLEDWASGHYLEVAREPIVKWSAGDVVMWEYDTPHLAANIGVTPRYTLQITGHL